MKKTLRIARNYFFYCGIEREEYNAVKKDAYISNFRVWRLLHFLMAFVFGLLLFFSCFNEIMRMNRPFYLLLFAYSLVVSVLFLVMEQDSLAGQLIIYLSISLLLFFGCLITQNKPNSNASTFIVLLVLTPMFMIDKPFFMAIELNVAAIVFLIWMKEVKTPEVFHLDLVNVLAFTFVGVFLNIIANSLRIKEFVLTRRINIQKDIDELTGIKNKGALTREINSFLSDPMTDKGLLFILDVDKFKSINDTYGHDIGDQVIIQLGQFLDGRFTGDDIAGRFGGDEFVIFIKNTDDPEVARTVGDSIVRGASEKVKLPDRDRKISVSIGVAIYTGSDKNYSDIFKKADLALYQAKADSVNRCCVYEG